MQGRHVGEGGDDAVDAAVGSDLGIGVDEQPVPVPPPPGRCQRITTSWTGRRVAMTTWGAGCYRSRASACRPRGRRCCSRVERSAAEDLALVDAEQLACAAVAAKRTSAEDPWTTTPTCSVSSRRRALASSLPMARTGSGCEIARTSASSLPVCSLGESPRAFNPSLTGPSACVQGRHAAGAPRAKTLPRITCFGQEVFTRAASTHVLGSGDTP